MKSVKITHSKQLHNRLPIYRVSLGNDFYFDFTDKKKVDLFCNATENFLNHCYIKLNNCLCDLYTRHRNSFFLYYHHNRSNQLLEEKELQNSLRNAEHKLDHFLTRCNSENANYWAFTDATVIVKDLTTAAQSLLKLSISRSSTQAKYELENAIEELQALNRELARYGAAQATGSYNISPSQFYIKAV